MNPDIDAVLRWLAKHPGETVIVGGQALAIWERVLDVPPSPVTQDIDLLDSRARAEALASAIGGTIKLPTLDDATPNIAVILKDGVQLVDVLDSVFGVDTATLRSRAVKVGTRYGGPIRLLHPLDCIRSKSANYLRLPSKRTAKDLSQLQSSLHVCRAYAQRLILHGQEKGAIRMANSLFDQAMTRSSKELYLSHGVDLIEAVPSRDQFTVSAFKQENLPRQLHRVQVAREKYRRSTTVNAGIPPAPG